MKKALLVFGSLLIAGLSFAQSLTLSETNMVYADADGGFDYGEVTLTNTSANTISVAVRLERRCHADDGSGVQFCFGDLCFGPYDVNTAIEAQGALITLAPNESTTDMTAHLFYYDGEGSDWRLYYYDIANPSDEAVMELSWAECSESNVIVNVGEENAEDLILYPNPTTDVLNVEGAAGKLYTVFNIVGEQVAAGTFNATRESLNVSNLESGLYFLQTGSQTRQFVVR